jgi:hypothetical protein
MGKWDLPESENLPIGPEVAEKAVKDLIAYYHVDVANIPNAKDKRAVEASLNSLQKAYRAGYLENVREGGTLKVKQHLQDPPGEMRELVYGKMQGRHKRASDGFEENDRYARIYAILASLSGNPPEVLEALSKIDCDLAEALGLVFLLG